MNSVELTQGTGPIILAFPHSGIWLPEEIKANLNETGQKLCDTDWHVDQLYADLLPEASILKANFHRYVIDANRAPDDASLYPGQNTTSLCPVTDFDGEPIWQEGTEPDTAEINRRRTSFHALYHHMLEDMIETVKAKHGFAILYDCHSIRSQAPFLFEGVLPSLNIGTNSGSSCAKAIEEAAVEVCAASNFSHVVNGRFKGGWTTRHYGQPDKNVHAIQMEIAQSAYMQEEAPWSYLPDRAEILREQLQKLLHRLNTISL